jgi:hypothetical protein
MGESFLVFFFVLLRSKSKMENGYFFTKNFAWCLVPFYRMMGQNPKFFWVKWETKHTLKIEGIVSKINSSKISF